MAKLFAVSLRPELMRGLLPSVLAYAISQRELSRDALVLGKLFAIESIITRCTLAGVLYAGKAELNVWDTQLGLLRQYVKEFGEVYSKVDRTYADLTLEVESALSRVRETGGATGWLLTHMGSGRPQTLSTKFNSSAALEASKELDSAIYFGR